MLTISYRVRRLDVLGHDVGDRRLVAGRPERSVSALSVVDADALALLRVCRLARHRFIVVFAGPHGRGAVKATCCSSGSTSSRSSIGVHS
jgi:hypothetical protein